MAWVAEHQRQPSGGVRQIFIHNLANGPTGPDCDYAITLR
jgi:hypothetical protein